MTVRELNIIYSKLATLQKLMVDYCNTHGIDLSDSQKTEHNRNLTNVEIWSDYADLYESDHPWSAILAICNEFYRRYK